MEDRFDEAKRQSAVNYSHTQELASNFRASAEEVPYLTSWSGLLEQGTEYEPPDSGSFDGAFFGSRKGKVFVRIGAHDVGNEGEDGGIAYSFITYDKAIEISSSSVLEWRDDHVSIQFSDSEKEQLTASSQRLARLGIASADLRFGINYAVTTRDGKQTESILERTNEL